MLYPLAEVRRDEPWRERATYFADLLDRARPRGENDYLPLQLFGGHALRVTLQVNGEERSAEAEPRMLLVFFLREALGLTGTKVGCDTSSCGACTSC